MSYQSGEPSVFHWTQLPRRGTLNARRLVCASPLQANDEVSSHKDIAYPSQFLILSRSFIAPFSHCHIDISPYMNIMFLLRIKPCACRFSCKRFRVNETFTKRFSGKVCKRVDLVSIILHCTLLFVLFIILLQFTVKYSCRSFIIMSFVQRPSMALNVIFGIFVVWLSE